MDDIVRRFERLNPYDRSVIPGSILKVEAENFDTNGRRRQLWCEALSAKRYSLFTSEGGKLVLRKVSEHGLGYLLNPVDPDDPSDDWIEDTWNFMLCRSLGLPATERKWMDRPAATRVTVSSPVVLRWFKAMNEGKPYAAQIKPANFLLLFHPDPLDPSGALPIAPYEPQARKWLQLDCIDRRNREPVRITTERSDGSLQPGMVRVRTYREVIADYEAHPEAKSLGRDGKPVTRRTVGVLRRRPVEGKTPIRYIGKEGNRLDDRISGLVTSADEYRNEYVDLEGEWRRVILPALAAMDRKTLAERSGLHRRTIERYIYKGAVPRPALREMLTEIALRHCESSQSSRDAGEACIEG